MLPPQAAVFILLFVVNITCTVIPSSQQSSDSTVRLVHVLFRHGDRVKDASTYPNDPYVNETYFPYGIGQLTNRGKQREYMIGKALRERYNNFLGDLYSADVLDAVSTAMNRTKMSLELVLAGLYPPKHTDLEWDTDLNWQPIPYNYVPLKEDKLLTLSLSYCPNFGQHYTAYVNSPSGQKVQQKYTELFQYLTKHTGKLINSTLDVYNLYLVLATEQEWGLKLPAWTINVFPKYIEEAAIDHYLVSTATTKLKQLSGGFLVKQMIKNIQLKVDKKLIPQSRKLYLYSGHDINLVYVLNTLEVYFPHIPPYGAFLLVELHEINHIYGVKILYQDYWSSEPKFLKIPGCESFCPLKEFVKILEKNLPVDHDMCSKAVAAHEGGLKSGASPAKGKKREYVYFYILIYIFCNVFI